MRRSLSVLILAMSLAQPVLAADQGSSRTTLAGDRVRFETTKGAFEVVLYPKEAPKTVANFEKLVKSGFYNGLTFHRVISGFVAQGGDPKGNGTGGPGWTIPDERNDCKHLPGSLAMAKFATPNSAGSQFYVCLNKLPKLDGKYTIFGQVSKGLDVVMRLQATEKNGKPTGGKLDRMLKVYVLPSAHFKN